MKNFAKDVIPGEIKLSYKQDRYTEGVAGTYTPTYTTSQSTLGNQAE